MRGPSYPSGSDAWLSGFRCPQDIYGVCVTFWLGSYLVLGKVFSRIELPGRNIVNRFAEEY